MRIPLVRIQSVVVGGAVAVHALTHDGALLEGVAGKDGFVWTEVSPDSGSVRWQKREKKTDENTSRYGGK